ncbi:MAG: ATP-grasp domain-containing protein [Spirochaetia bacterium]|nr:ATP-grasp domain-containing protein [Spirochaetia bacterium]
MITQRAFDLGIPCPGTLRIKPTALQMSTLGEFQKQYPLPWIVKPVQGHGMRGVFLVESIAEAVKQLQSADSDCLIQECIPGAIGSMHLVGLLFNRDGKVIRRFSSHSIRTLYANGGPATAGISKNLPELIRTTERIFESLGGWRGPANVEWMLDPRDGRFKFIEVNPRLWGYGFLAVGAGVNFPVALVEAALGRDPGADPGFKDGITMVRTTHDLIFDACPFDVKQG